MKESIVYLNYAATNNCLFEDTKKVLCDYLAKNQNQAINRGVTDRTEHQLLFQTRKLLASFFHAEDSSYVIFTQNATMSLNMILNGLLVEKDHVVTTSLEHNAVARPLHLLSSAKKIKTTYVSCESGGILSLEKVKKAILPETKLLVMTHASNVLGTILPIKECFKYAKSKGVITVLDSSQTAGVIPVDMNDLYVDVLAFTGHKGLMGIAGIGGFILNEVSVQKMSPWIVGGTGSFSYSLDTPNCLPDRFEAGTLNMLGILSLKSSVEQLNKIGLRSIRLYEQNLTEQFLKALKELPIDILGTKEVTNSVPVVSINAHGWDSGELTQILYDQYGIITRSGLHCSPLAHQTAGTLSGGAVRFSFGYQTKEKEIKYALNALESLLVK